MIGLMSRVFDRRVDVFALQKGIFRKNLADAFSTFRDDY